jgi:hypothetical protein
VADLAAGSGEQCRIDELSAIEPVGGCGLLARRGRSRGIEHLGGLYVCTLDASEWSTVEGLLAPFAEPAARGFQYLADGAAQWVVSTSRSW